MDVPAFADFLGDSQKGVRSKIARGLLPHRRLGGRVIVLRDEVESFLRALPGVTPAQAVENIASRRQARVGGPA